jgi:AhpD family alkylhydroperoxidase
MRVDYAKVLPEARAAMMGLERVVHDSTLDPRLVELVKVRASQINGCARCVEMHTKDARAIGEDQERLDLVAVWSEAGCFSPAERAALGWCEALTDIAHRGAPDDTYTEVAAHFDPEQVVALTLAVAAINAWNRLNVAFAINTGGYVSPRRPSAHAASRPVRGRRR